MSAMAPTVRKDSTQSSKEGVCKTTAPEGGFTKSQHSNTATVSVRPGSSHLQISIHSNPSNNTVAGPGPSTIQRAAERRLQNRTAQLNSQHDEDSHTLAASTDIVTNEERVKSPTITRVLSPMRPRRTPVLVNAPDVRWRLDAHMRHIPSLDSILTSSTTSASETSTVCLIPISPHSITLPSSVASSLLTVMPEERNPVDIPLPPSPPPIASPIFTRYNETVERPRPSQRHYFYQAHHLSPVTEASSGFSVRSLSSSIVDLDIQNIATAERRGLNEVTRQNVHIISAHRSQVSLSSQRSRQSIFRERFSLDGAEHYTGSLRSGRIGGTPVQSSASEVGERGITDANEEYAQLERKMLEKKKARTICGHMEKLKEKMSSFGGRVRQNVVRKLGTWAGFEWV